MPSAPPHPDPQFTVEATDGDARAARFATAHGLVRTPAFMPVGTRASLKGLTNEHIAAIDPEVLLANTYHLHLRPGEDLVAELGGLHAFTGWDRPLLTDSGGYQVFSLGGLVEVGEDGVTFRNHLDGRRVRLGPVEAMAIQEALGADIVMAMDHCVALPAPPQAVEAAVERTTRWARRCAEVRTREDQLLFGIVQGGTDERLRRRSAAALVGLDLPGYALGGLAVGEGTEALRATVAACSALLPADRPRYLMGVGHPVDLLEAIAAGQDLFDCVLPTRNGRRGWLLTPDGTVRIGTLEHRRDERPLDPCCRCHVCRTHSRAYLRHLFQVNEHVATTLGSLHNVTFLVDLVRTAREQLLAGTFRAWKQAWVARFERGEASRRATLASDPQGARRSEIARAEQDRAIPEG